MALGLPAGAEDAGHPRVRPRQPAGGNAARGAGADHAHVIGLDDRQQLAARRVEHMDEKAVAAAVGGVGLVADDALRRQRALQDMQHRLRQAGAGARRVLRLAERQVAMRRFDRFQRHGCGQHLFYVIFREKQRHASLLKRW